MSDHPSTHIPKVVSLASSMVAVVTRLSSDQLIQIGGLVIAGVGVVWSIVAHCSNLKRLESENQSLKIELAAERAASTQKDHRITRLESREVAPVVTPVAVPVVPKPEGGTT